MLNSSSSGKSPLRSGIRTLSPHFVAGNIDAVANYIASQHDIHIIKTTQSGTRITYHTNNGNIHITPSQDGFYGRFMAGLKGTTHYYRITPSSKNNRSGYMVCGNGSLYATAIQTP